MKPSSLVLLIVVLPTGTALALAPMGQPTSSLKEGQMSAGVSYMNGDEDIHFVGGPAKGIDLESVLVTVALGIREDQMDVFLRGGVGTRSCPLMDTDAPAAGAGTRITLTGNETLSWGLLAQFVWYGFESGTVESDLYDIQIATGPSWHVMDNLMVYGGPFVHLIDGTQDMKGIGVFDLEQESALGGYVGTGLEIGTHLTVASEFQFTPNASGFAVTANWRF